MYSDRRGQAGVRSILDRGGVSGRYDGVACLRHVIALLQVQICCCCCRGEPLASGRVCAASDGMMCIRFACEDG